MSWYDGDDTVDFDDVICETETEMALGCFNMDDSKDSICWVPKSMVHEESDVQAAGDTGTIIVSRWWAKKAGLS